MLSLKQEYRIKSSAEGVWDALTNPKTINNWGGGPAVMSDEENFNFKLWGGDIWGKNKKVINNKLLVQDWYSGEWEKASTVKFELEENENSVRLTLTHTNIPDSELKDIEQGWKDYYLIPLKNLLEK